MIANTLPGKVSIRDEPTAVAGAVAATLQRASNERRDEQFTIALAGGSTPKLLYEQLAGEPYRSTVDWRRWQVYFSDDRAVPPDHPASNYGLARTTLLDRVPIAPDHIHPMAAADPDLDGAAERYSKLLASGLGSPPRLDCVLLGLGTDGHVASLFPGTSALDEDRAYATRGLADVEPHDRMTLTFPTINAARRVIFTVTGSGKRRALQDVIEGTVPAARVRPTDGTVSWFLDRAAAGA